jgi:hypothetical protein
MRNVSCGVFAALSLLALNGCALAGSMNVEPVAVSTQKPGNVALFVAVSQHGAGVAGLDKQAFKIYENGVPLDNQQIQLTLLPTASAASQRAAVLVDMSKMVGAEDKKALSAALRSFIVRLRQREAVSLYAFDGSAKVHLVADYTKDARAEPDEKDTSMDRLLAFSRRDSSSSLYTAVMDGAQKLSASLDAEGRPIENGTLIVIALNPDLAGRVDDGKLREFIASSPHHYFLMTVGPWATSADVSFIGKNGSTRAASLNTMTTPLETVASAVDDDYFRNYLVSYCSPARAGKRQLRLEVATTDEQGHKSIGRYDTEFDATGFGPGCNSQALPHFVIAKPKDSGARVASSNPSNSKVKAGSKPAPPNTAPENDVKVSSAAPPPPKPSASAATPIAEPPSGLGYE